MFIVNILLKDGSNPFSAKHSYFLFEYLVKFFNLKIGSSIL